MMEIYKNGPIVMSFESPIELGFYKEGIFVPLTKSEI